MTEMTDARGIRTLAHHDLGGYGDAMQQMPYGDALYVGHFGVTGMGTSVLDVGDRRNPRLVRQWPAPQGSHTHKVQAADGLLLVNQEQFRGGEPHAAGMAVYSLEDPLAPRQIGFFGSGGRGVHRIVWRGGRYAYVSATPDGFDDRIWVIVDLSDPEHPVEAGRWWWPGMWRDGDETPDWSGDRRYAAHHALLADDIAYLGFGDAGMVVLDVGDVSQPKQIGHVNWSPGGDTHTCMPLPSRQLVVVTDEAIKDRCAEPEKRVRIVDVSEPTEPKVIASCPQPQGDFCERGLRFGPHNLHENQPVSYRSETLFFVTYFNAGLRVYDITDPARPEEVAHWDPPAPAGQEAPQINDVYVEADGLIWVGDRLAGGVYVLEP
jgi:hypothetical protein